MCLAGKATDRENFVCITLLRNTRWIQTRSRRDVGHLGRARGCSAMTRSTTTADYSLPLSFSLSRCALPRVIGCGLVRATKTQDETSVGHFTGGITPRLLATPCRTPLLRKSIPRFSLYCKIPMRSRGDTRSAHGQRSYGIRASFIANGKKKRPLSRSSLSHASAGSCYTLS